MLTLTYTRSSKDILHSARALGKVFFNTSAGKLSRPKWKNVAAFIVLRWLPLALVALPLIGIISPSIEIKGWMVIYLVIASVICGALLVMSNRENDLREILSALLESREPFELTLNDFGIETNIGGTASQTPWSVIREVLIVDDVLLFLTAEGAQYIPKNAFANESELHEFAKFAVLRVSKNPKYG